MSWRPAGTARVGSCRPTGSGKLVLLVLLALFLLLGFLVELLGDDLAVLADDDLPVLAVDLGVGRFVKIGIPAPQVTAPFVGVVEIVCGGLIMLGLLTRFAAIPLIIDISVAILSTKIPILLGHGFWRFTVGKLPTYGFWSAAHEARVDYAMLLGSIFLLIVGAGTWSIDARLSSKAIPRDS